MSRRPWPFAVRANRRNVVITVTIAVVLHIAAFAWIASVRQARRLAATPPNITGLGGGVSGTGGLPATGERNVHPFLVLDADSRRPLARAYVLDALSLDEAITNATGEAELGVRPAATFIVQVRKPGYAVHAMQVPNLERENPTRVVLLQPQQVPYASIDSIFLRRCQHCHGSDDAVNLTSHLGLTTSRFGPWPVVIPFKPDSSLLVRALIDSVPPPGARGPHLKGVGRFRDYEVEMIYEWVRQGARGPAVGR
ncbi:MAG: hypothetical protein FJ202_03425 [Gemmatimonadetes bacterium]|nr:hypothetical protein [Gemmatimonadota bacterium]